MQWSRCLLEGQRGLPVRSWSVERSLDVSQLQSVHPYVSVIAVYGEVPDQ